MVPSPSWPFVVASPCPDRRRRPRSARVWVAKASRRRRRCRSGRDARRGRLGPRWCRRRAGRPSWRPMPTPEPSAVTATLWRSPAETPATSTRPGTLRVRRGPAPRSAELTVLVGAPRPDCAVGRDGKSVVAASRDACCRSRGRRPHRRRDVLPLAVSGRARPAPQLQTMPPASSASVWASPTASRRRPGAPGSRPSRCDGYRGSVAVLADAVPIPTPTRRRRRTPPRWSRTPALTTGGVGDARHAAPESRGWSNVPPLCANSSLAPRPDAAVGRPPGCGIPARRPS